MSQTQPEKIAFIPRDGNEVAIVEMLFQRRDNPCWGRAMLRTFKRSLFNADPHCAYCRKPLTMWDSQIDHIFPVSRGGKDEPANFALACEGCNGSKGASTVEEWRERLMAGLFRGYRLVPETESVPA